MLTDDTMSEFQVSLGIDYTDLRIVEKMERILDFVFVVESFNHYRDIRIIPYQVFSVNPRLILFILGG
jgi:hypothetical protein